MKTNIRPYIVIIFNCLSALAFIFAFIFFMRMQDEVSKNTHFKNEGVVSRAIVTDLEKDKSVLVDRKGNKRTNDLFIIHVRHDPTSTIKFADFPAKVKEADLPKAPALSGNAMEDSKYIGVMFVTYEVYNQTKIGDMFNVVNTPYDKSSPEFVEKVTNFTPDIFYPRMAIALVLTIVFWLIGFTIKKSKNTAQ